MKSYIGIIYVNTNSLTSEKIAAGIIYFSKNRAEIIFSERKIKLVEQIVTADVSTFLENNFQLFKNKIKEINSKINENEFKNNVLSEEYFTYLNKYSQGLLMFDKLKPINIDLENQNVNEILLRFLGEKIDKKSRNRKFITGNKKSFSIKPENLKGILKPITILEGYFKGDKIKLFKEINFNKKNYYLVNDLYELKILKESLSDELSLPEKNIAINLVPKSILNNSMFIEIKDLVSNEFIFLSNKENMNKEITHLKDKGYIMLNDILDIQNYILAPIRNT